MDQIFQFAHIARPGILFQYFGSFRFHTVGRSLPELPVRAVAQERPPKIDPNLIVREQMRDGKLAVMVLTPKNRRYYPMTHQQWAVLQSFNGERNYCEIAEILTAQTSVSDYRGICT